MKKAYTQSQKKNAIGILSYIILLAACSFISVNLGIPDSETYFCTSQSSAVSAITEQSENVSGSHTVTAKLFGIVPVKDVNVEILPEMVLIPGGDVFGVKFFTKGVIVIGCTEIETEGGFINPSELSGIAKNDIINKVNGEDVNTVERLSEIVSSSDGKPLFFEYTRDGKEKSCELTPVKSKSDGKYKSGLWVRDSTAGIGTLTYYNPQTGEFAGLGHGICDVDTGELMPLLSGTVVDVDITDIIRGKSGAPGELKGSFSAVKNGKVTANTSFGVFGALDVPPDLSTKAMPAASRDEVKEGDATILANADGNGIKEYSVRLSKVDKHSDGTKCFVIEITDKELIALTGGIVQGMSGSPVIQNGKLIGAVTHVLVNDPAKGYGIFIENMLAEAEKNK